MPRVKREDEKKKKRKDKKGNQPKANNVQARTGKEKKKGQELLTDTLKARNYLKKKRRYKNWFIEREWENRGEAQLST